jgi:hypothetical protein
VSVESRKMLFSSEGPRLFEFAVYRVDPDKHYADLIKMREDHRGQLRSYW